MYSVAVVLCLLGDDELIMSTKRAHYGTWKTPIDLSALFEKPSSPRYPTYYQGQVYWLEARAKEGGRLVLMRREPDGQDVCLTPDGFNIRTRVHEYGGRCFVLGGGHVYFSNFADQRIYAQPLVPSLAQPMAITPASNADGTHHAYADFQLTRDGRYLVCVVERSHPDQENANYLAVVGIPPLGHDETPTEAQVLVDGCDFYANPVLSADGTRLAWIQWNHPNMPWDETELALAGVATADAFAVEGARVIAGGPGCAICQVQFMDRNRLVFALDRDAPESDVQNYWNLYVHQAGRVDALTADKAEYGYPHWVFGETRYTPLGDRRLLASRANYTGDELVDLDMESKTIKEVSNEYCGFAQLAPLRDKQTGANDALLVGSSSKEAPALLRYRAKTRKLEVLKQPVTMIEAHDISVAQPISYPTRDAMRAHAFFYPPKNADYEAPENTRPPLLIMVHGGPTSRTTPSLDLARQYWTTCGYAVLDINHRGSTGYGRQYRQLLRGRWGEYDAIDVVDGIEYLKAQDKIDATRVCIRGRSAGGYAVLRALTYFPEYFSAGACYFGIGNLATLAETTHKFELYYTDTLIAERYDPQQSRVPSSRYYTRSPIHYIDKVRSPMILFQGEDDKVVTAKVSREMVRVLEQHKIPHEYVEYPNEGHGFRRSETNIDALQRETAFFDQALKLNHS